MTLQEAFYKQKDELHSLQREVRRQDKELTSLRKSTAADERVQKLLGTIQHKNKKISEINGIMERYRKLYEQQKQISKDQEDIIWQLQNENRNLQWQLDCFLGKRTDAGLTAAEEARAEIAALKDEISRLNARLDANSMNAGIPTARTSINQQKRVPNSREKTGKKKGGQPGHEKHEMLPFSPDEVTSTELHGLESCPKCGSHNLEETGFTIKDELDYEVVVKKVRHKFVEYKCPDCGSIVRAPYNGLVAKNQYGNVMQSMALSLMNLGFVSINRTRRILSGFSPAGTDTILSEGYLIKLQKRYSKRLKSFVNDIKERLLSLPLLYWDDTVVFINTARACLRFYGDEKLALYTAHMHKDLDGLMDDSILPALSDATTVMHDHNTINYHDGFVFRNVECLQHLERDLQKIIDIAHHSWASELRGLIQEKIHERKAMIEEGAACFSAAETASILSMVASIIERAWTEWSTDQNRYFGDDERALISRLQHYEQNYFEWIRDFSIPTTNNLSERSLRFIKIKDKVSGQFQSIKYAEYFADIRTYLETCARNGVNEFKALLRLTENRPFTVGELLGEA